MVRFVTHGDLVMVHFLCKDTEDNILESSYDLNEPLTFEVGAGDMLGNRLFQGFDEAVRGMAIGQKTILEAVGGEWQKDLLFMVPINHPEIERLQGRYKNQGGLKPGMVIELANSQMAMVIEMNDKNVKIDANNMMAGKKLFFELEVIAVKDGTGRVTV